MSSTGKGSRSSATNLCHGCQSTTQLSRARTIKLIMLRRFTGAILRLVVRLAALFFLFMTAVAYPYRAEAVRDGRTISGLVEYGGAPPSRSRLAITKDREVC